VSRGQADVAIVKNHVWTHEKPHYPSLAAVGADSGENPDNTLIVSMKLDAATRQRLSAVLLGLEADPSPDALATRGRLKIKRFVPTTAKDFSHTLDLLKRAGVTRGFGFAY
jgi:ABC-type phosphate/phosphonate transport system substrate-binding protein